MNFRRLVSNMGLRFAIGGLPTPRRARDPSICKRQSLATTSNHVAAATATVSIF